ncbi:MAG: 1-pyrroline-5-carboxylate dehydrogenase [Candidatus Omnitrophica bacterium CG11_big_fil_rev_8_21_14_0_20_63_9]|nr:MAG: 1-pyrroline-5-carboxylate dehydrogenase [Candidatus Omnitrophica bacterium CG11_big_fil_rev_8_21_14_0_20_63_9]
MTARPASQPSWDLAALETRTQAIGQALLTCARHEHAQLSVLNRWTAQVLAWCLADPDVKSRMLRFIDALPSLRRPADVARHVVDYFPAESMRLPAALRLGAQAARRGLLTRGALSSLVRQLSEQIARQFIAESSAQGAGRAVRQLAARGATCSLDVLGEQVLTEAEADAYVAQCRTLLERCAQAYQAMPDAAAPIACGPRPNLSIKPSALTPRFDPISPDQSAQRAMRRLIPLLEDAARYGATINLDMEQYELRDLTLALTKRLLLREQGLAGASLGLVIQAYLCDAEPVVEELLGWLAHHERAVTVRLVKGAYWDSEVARAQQFGWSAPVHLRKTATDAAFERLTRRLLSAAPLVTVAVASHNVRSVAHAMAAAERLGLAKDQLEFQFLFGMGDALQAAVVQQGYPVRVYTPIGELIPGMAYLVRRILENTSNESFLRQESLRERSVEELLRAPYTPESAASDAPAAAPGAWRVEPFLDFSKPQPREAVMEALRQVRSHLGQRYRLLTGDGAIDTPELWTATNPARPSEALGDVCCAGPAELQRAVSLAAAAQAQWARTPVRERTACLRRAADRLREMRHTLIAWEILEVGKTWREADADVLEAIEYLDYYSQQMEELASGRPVAQVAGERNAYRYVPRGLAVVIAPWNFPCAILTGMTAAALAAGNAVLMKPAERSSILAWHVARALIASGFPPGVVQCLPGSGERIGSALVRHPATRVVLFTGSKAVGLSIAQACAQVTPEQRFVKHVVAEMGGKNAIVVDADADLDAAVAGTLRSAFGYGGQKCSAASRVIVHRDVYDRFVQRLAAATDRLVVGDPADPDTDLGPLIEPSAQQRLRQAAERAARVGTVAYRYPSERLPGEGWFVGPALVTEVPHSDALAQEELFGPLVCLFRVNTFEEGLALANDTAYALTGGVYTRLPSHLEQAIRTFDVGNLYLNRPITGAMVGRQPFGGHKLSGLGTKAGGPDYLFQLLLPKTICTNTTRHGMPLE